MPRNVTYLLLFFLSPLVAFPQMQWVDSLKTALAAQSPDTFKVRTLIRISEIYCNSAPDSALIYGQQALALADKLNFDKGMFWSIVALNGSLFVLGNYALELDYAFKAIPLAEKINDPYTIGFARGMLSDCYYNLGEYDISMKYWRDAVNTVAKTNPKELFRVYGKTSYIFVGMQQYDSALIYAQKGLSIFKRHSLFREATPDSKYNKSNTFLFLADALASNGEYDSALFYYQQSLSFSQEIHIDINGIDAYNGIAIAYEKKNIVDSAIWYGKKALSEKISRNYPVAKLKSAELLAAIYQRKHQADSALKYLLIASGVKDSLFKREKAIAVQNILFKEQEKNKAIEVASLKLQNEYRTYFLIGSLIILLTAAGVVIRNRRLRQLQKIRNSIADDLHDEIGSTLSSIGIMNELAKSKSPEALTLLTSIGESTQIIQETMSDIVWTLKVGDSRFENILQRMNQFSSEILNSKNMTLDFRSQSSLSSSILTMEQRKNFYLFFKEAINNVAKHSQATKVNVSITQKDQHVVMNIDDNGEGFDTESEFKGNGMKTLTKRAEELCATLQITSQRNKGTSVQLRFKIT